MGEISLEICSGCLLLASYNINSELCILVYSQSSKTSCTKVHQTQNKISFKLPGSIAFQWKIDESFEVPRDSKLRIDFYIKFNGFNSGILIAQSVISESAIHDTANDFELQVLDPEDIVTRYKKNKVQRLMSDSVLINLLKDLEYARATVRIRQKVQRSKTPIGDLRVIIWQCKKLNSKFPCFATINTTGSVEDIQRAKVYIDI